MPNLDRFLRTCLTATGALTLGVLLSACAAQTGVAQAPSSPDVSAPPPPRVADNAPPATSQGACNIASLEAVGEPLTEARSRELMSQSGARDVRVLPPNSVATMDYREDRLNIELDEAGRITALRCG
ncbi:I78 family peptidase inhibitor [Halomonas sp. GD1P12]|uniref:I78 family peptidase inhibitor n=1 Tax=Halomonas sp. GD1P12 TaxID=2982691 RepID=UPI0021E4E51E|nr:I78 family peptidase inhibitor [Halomonas sp. GD1P12]UYG00462.1 I78 family peptidase inhibitor [Halomonas sp. GD1P12]